MTKKTHWMTIRGSALSRCGRTVMQVSDSCRNESTDVRVWSSFVAVINELRRLNGWKWKLRGPRVLHWFPAGLTSCWTAFARWPPPYGALVAITTANSCFCDAIRLTMGSMVWALLCFSVSSTVRFLSVLFCLGEHPQLLGTILKHPFIFFLFSPRS